MLVYDHQPGLAVPSTGLPSVRPCQVYRPTVALVSRVEVSMFSNSPSCTLVCPCWITFVLGNRLE